MSQKGRQRQYNRSLLRRPGIPALLRPHCGAFHTVLFSTSPIWSINVDRTHLLYKVL